MIFQLATINPLTDMVGLLGNVIYEIGFLGIVAGIFISIKNTVKSLNLRERIFFLIILISGLLLKLNLSLFGPVRGFYSHYQNAYYALYNFLNNNFFSITHRSEGSFGSTEYFFNKILYFFSSFDIYNIYYINIGLSTIKGFLIFYLCKLLFKNKAIAFISFLMFTFLPVEIRFSGTELHMSLSSVVLLLFFIFTIKYLNSYKRRYLLVLIGVILASFFGRRDVGALTIFLLGLVFIYLMVFNPVFRKRFCSDLLLQISSLAVVIAALIYYEFHLLMISEEFFLSRIKALIYLFHIPNYLNPPENSNNYIPYITYTVFPLYLYLLFRSFWVLLFFSVSRKREYISMLFLTIVICGFLRINMEHQNLQELRIALVTTPFIIIIASVVIYRIFILFKLKNYIIIFLSSVIIIISIFQNIDLLTVSSAKKAEEDFLRQQIRLIPENSLILTITDNEFGTIPYQAKRSTQAEWMEFPGYLLAGRKIDFMGIYNDAAHRDIINKYDNVYYYRGPQVDNVPEALEISSKFENRYDLVKIASVETPNVNYEFWESIKIKDFDFVNIELHKVAVDD